MESQPFKSVTLYDTLATFQDGINSDPNPLLLPKSELAWSRNASLRGGFVHQRPPHFKRTMTFPSTAIEGAVITGHYQGGGYYRGDFGPQQLVAQISGRLFTFTPTGNVIAVAEITIPGDPNDPTVPQVWMNQAEKWLIITDGTSKLPIFYDGVSSRRSYGPSVLLGFVISSNPVNFPNPRVIGEIIEVTTSAPWTGGFNIPVIFNGAFYQPVSSVTPIAEYEVVLTTTNHTVGQAGVTIPIGTSLVVKSPVHGQIVGVAAIGPANTCRTDWEYLLSLSTPYIGSVGDVLDLQSLPVSGCPTVLPTAVYQWTVTQLVNPTTIKVHKVFPDLVLATIAFGQFIPNQGANQPDVVLGVTVAPFVLPAIGGSVTAKLNQFFPGPDGTIATINFSTGFATFSVVGVPPPTPSTFSLINLSDTSKAGMAVPTGSVNGQILSVPELPAGRMGAYGLGHQAMSLVDGISFIYGDAVGGPAGTPANNYRDAVLKTTENTFLSGGGSFRVPNSGEIITSMRFATVLDAAYGQGPLQLGTPTSIFTCDVPTDRAKWILLENPILTQTLIGRGPLGQNSTIPVNSDTFFRTTDGIGSMIFGRRDFVTWGNVPISAEMNRLLLNDNKSLLAFGTAVTFDNRFLGGANPQQVMRGIFHSESGVLNFDPLSTIRGKAPSIWESDWDGLNVLQYLTGIFAATERCFAFTVTPAGATTQTIELYELLPEATTETSDNGTTPITWEFESAAIFNKDVKKSEILCGLRDGEISLGNVIGNVTVSASYKPDQSDTWQPWHSFTIAGTNTPAYYPRLGLGEPSATPCNANLNVPARDAYTFQFRLIVTGCATFFRARFMAVTLPTPKFQQPICNI